MALNGSRERRPKEHGGAGALHVPFRPAGRKRAFSQAMAWLGALLLIGAGVFLPGPGGPKAVPAAQPAEVTYPVKSFQNGKAQFFQYKTDDGITIKYFVLKSSDGVIRAAFDACDVCWPEGKGYFQKDDTMVCRNCGRRFVSVKINVVTGGCNPGALNREVVGDQVVIKVKDILEGKRYFNFAKKR